MSASGCHLQNEYRCAHVGREKSGGGGVVSVDYALMDYAAFALLFLQPYA